MRKLVLFGVFSVLTAVSCGNFTLTVSSDTKSPSVVSTFPENLATGTALSLDITATFSEQLDAATVSAASFSLNNGVTGTVSYSSDEKKAVFTIDSNLTANTTYTATLSDTITDRAGNSLSRIAWSFTTGS